MLKRLLDPGLLLAAVITLGAAACGGNPVRPVADKVVSHSSNKGTVTLKVEGLVTRLDGACPALTFIVNSTADVTIMLVGTRVTTTAQTEYEASSCASLRNNMRVQIEGLWQPDGTVIAVKVKYDPK